MKLVSSFSSIDYNIAIFIVNTITLWPFSMLSYVYINLCLYNKIKTQVHTYVVYVLTSIYSQFADM